MLYRQMRELAATSIACVLFLGGSALASPTADEALREALKTAETSSVIAALEQGADPNKLAYALEGISWFGELNSSVGPRMIFRGKSYPKAILGVADIVYAHGGRVNDSDLYWPIMYGDIEIVGWLLDHGASQAVKLNGYSPAEYALSRSGTETYGYLVSRGARPVAQPMQEQIGLTVAVTYGQADQGAKRIAAGAHVNQPDPAGYTALNSALAHINWQEDRGSVVKWLLQQGADPNLEGYASDPSALAVDSSTPTPFLPPLHTFVFFNSLVLAGEMGQESKKSAFDILEALIKAGARVSGRDGDGATPLHWAVLASNSTHSQDAGLELAQALLKHGAKVSSKNNRGETPLDLAERGPMINLLKKNGATE
jgi:ankyrin repeat protein